MPDFSALLDATAKKPHSPDKSDRERSRPRKKPSISLAAGLIMASESGPRTPVQALESQRERGRKEERDEEEEPWSDNLFYAYAKKSDQPDSPPSILTFASARVCHDWWTLVQREYPASLRPGAQLFLLKDDDLHEQMAYNLRFHRLRNQWFCSPSDSIGATNVIPLQDHYGRPVAATPKKPPQPPNKNDGDDAPRASASPVDAPHPQHPPPLDLSALNSSLEKMAAMVWENSAQIRALSVAQSSGLARMQEIAESNTAQIKSLADNQSSLAALLADNASHYIALSNATFASHEQHKEQVRTVLASNALHVKQLAAGQRDLLGTCKGMMRAVETMGTSVAVVNDTVKAQADVQAQTQNQIQQRSNPFSELGSPFVPSALTNRISPSPRKLNRRVKGVWYEYDMSESVGSGSATSTRGTPRGSVSLGVGKALDTPPKTPPGKSTRRV
ncbi:hypothetical protein BDV95DRAFT_628789 [Massariosphaeria phaeospora]|uniref:Uncharacterized protein n=1 Tax=Massariosphaeria phaeospora TaxID=100035 RepID=A0A7C8M8H9_9PLEO|nr:hypothetical protein BDV95DRAFT_628789 [Massariosphaeria phaeospora]